MLTIKFDIMGKSGVLYSQSGRSDFYGYKIVNISKWRSALYISQVVHIYMFFRLCTYFLDNLVEFHSRNKEILETARRWTQTEDLKHHDEALVETIKMNVWNAWFEARTRKLWQFGDVPRLQNRKAWFGKSEGPIFTDQSQIWVEIFIVSE
jgi:hypothetical protein